MRRVLLLMFAIAAGSGCSGDSQFPEATGKGTVRAINAIEASPDVTFLIEERALDGVGYKESAAPQRWDDLTYTFHFDAVLSPGAARQRIASQFLDVVADRDYILVASGALETPTITIWENAERSFEAADTVFEARFGHVSDSLGAVDVFFGAPGVAPVAGAEVASLSFGEVAPAMDFAEGDYVLTVTAAGDPSTVFYTSDTVTFGSQITIVLTIFDGDESDTAPIAVRGFTGTGGTLFLPDVNFPPTIRFIHSSRDLGTVDVYDDEALANAVLTGHAFGDITGDIPAAAASTTFRYTPAGNTGSILLEAAAAIAAGQHVNLTAVGEAGSFSFTLNIPSRRSISTFAKFSLFNGTVNHESMDLYIVEAGESIADEPPRVSGIQSARLSPILALDAGSYDVYLTPFDDKTVLDGPVRIDVSLGDVIESIAFDTVDPATAQFTVFPAP